jgi:hypothetical protein
VTAQTISSSKSSQPIERVIAAAIFVDASVLDGVAWQ